MLAQQEIIFLLATGKVRPTIPVKISEALVRDFKDEYELEDV